MNAMTEKLDGAGVDTLGARLTAACIEAIKRSPDSTVEAWRQVGYAFGHEFVRGLMNDMQRNAPAKERGERVNAHVVPARQEPKPDFDAMKRTISAPYTPRVIPPERLEKRRELRQMVRSKYKNSGDVAWSDVGWHELHALKRDGVEAKALLEAGPAEVPNDGRTAGDVLGVARVDQIIGAFRGA